MQYISDYFDSFYIQRDYNRDFNIIKQLKAGQISIIRVVSACKQRLYEGLLGADVS